MWRGSESLRGVELRTRPRAPRSASPRCAAAASVLPPDGSRRFAIAPPGGSARQGRSTDPSSPPAARPRERGRLLPPSAGPAPSPAGSSGCGGVGPDPPAGPPAAASRSSRRTRADWLGGGRESWTSNQPLQPGGGREEAAGGGRGAVRTAAPGARPRAPPFTHLWLRCRPDPVGGRCHPTAPARKVDRTSPGPC